MALAQSLGREGNLSVAAERLSGITSGNFSYDPGGPIGDIEADYFSFRLLNDSARAPGPLAASLPVFAVPRIGIDYFLADQFSLGGSLGLVSTSWDEGDTAISTLTFILLVRAGYWIQLNETFGFWPRGGLTLLTTSTSDEADDEVNFTLPALSLEAPLMIALGPAFLEVAATLDASVGGSGETLDDGDEQGDFDVSVVELGIQAGLGIVF